MNQQEKEELILQWLQGDKSDQELSNAISDEELSQYKSILSTVDNWIPEGTEKAPNTLPQIFQTPKEAKVISMDRTPWLVGIAASIALILVVSVLFFRNQETVYYAENENLEVLLPDETTTAILSPGSKLIYDDFSDEDRVVSVEGRVYFDVTRKGAFEVNYQGGQIAVLGTQFEVINFEDYFEASCFEGSVQVSYSGQSATMVMSERVTFENGRLPKMKMRQTTPGWTSGEEKFDNDLLTKVIRVLETRYKVKVESNDISLDRRFTGSMPLDNLEAACRNVFAPFGITYTIEDRIVSLSE